VNLGKVNRKAQTWSVDLVLGVVIFLLVVVIIYSLIASRPENESQLRDDADKIYLELNSNENSEEIPQIVDGSTLSEDELIKLYNESYAELKKKLGIDNDFCIVVVTDNSILIDVPVNSTYDKRSIGTGKDVLLAPNTYCGDI
jgi:hypothetical protein